MSKKSKLFVIYGQNKLTGGLDPLSQPMSRTRAIELIEANLITWTTGPDNAYSIISLATIDDPNQLISPI